MTHSPLPWKLETYRDSDGYDQLKSARTLDADGIQIMDCMIDDHKAPLPDDQTLIVTAVNAHAALVAALEACRDHIIGTTGASAGSDSEEMVQGANAALELARKGGA